MKKVLKWVGRVLGVILGLVLCFALYVQVDGIPKYTPQKPDIKVESTPVRVARGKKFAQMLCSNCHKNPTTRQLTGRVMDDAPPEFGVLASKNITNDKKKGIGARTDGELIYLLRTGVRWDGQYIPPYMAKLPHLSDEDLFSIIAFLRSDDDLVRANDADAEPVRPSFLTKFLSHVAFKPLPYPTQKIEAPPITDKVAYGRYMVAALDCYPCHSADFKTMNVFEPEKSEGYLGGGNQINQPNGVADYSRNITPDEETGIGKWSYEDFEHALRAGFAPDKSLLREPMMRYGELSDDEVAAIWAYLRTVPKIHRANTPRPPDPPVTDTSPGSLAYHKYGCFTCHGETGIAVGDLRSANLKYATDDALVAFLKNPDAAIPGTVMPKWEGVVLDADYPALVSHVRKLASASH
jgi:cytochrome c2